MRASERVRVLESHDAAIYRFDPVMGVFVPIFCLSLGTIVIGTANFAVPDGVVSSEFAYDLFWYAPTTVVRGQSNPLNTLLTTQGLRRIGPHSDIWHDIDMVRFLQCWESQSQHTL